MVSVRLALLETQEQDAATTNEQHTFVMRNFTNLNIDLRTPISPMPLPEESDTENILVKVEGNTTAISYSFVIKPESASSPTTYSQGASDVVANANYTVRDQIDFLKQDMQGKSIDDHYKLQIKYSEDGDDDLTFYGFVNNISIVIDSSAPATAVCTISFLVGDTITSLDEDIPSEPSFSIGTVSGTTIPLTISLPVDKGGSNNIVNYYIQYSNYIGGRGSRSPWKKYNSTDSSISGNVSFNLGSSDGIIADKTYSVRVAAKGSDYLKGEWSDWQNAGSATT